MPDIKIMKAVEYDKLPASFKKLYPFDQLQEQGYFLQKKYDGCFGKAIIERGKSRMVSRDGLSIKSCDHILRELENLAFEDGRHEPFVVLGEVWHETQPFPWISGKFRQFKPEPALRFVANDLLPLEMNTAEQYTSRLFSLQELVGYDDAPLAGKVGIADLGDATLEPMQAARLWKAEGGFDGAILRNPRAGYTVGMVKNGEIIKVKPTLSLDLRVLQVHVAEGIKTGRPVHTIDVWYNGVRTRVGSGIPHSFNDVPQAGQIVEIECMGLTLTGALREPRFKGIRLDKEQPDV